MSIEKLDFEQVIQEKIGYTIILNEVIHHIKTSDSFMVWSYLYSHSSNWQVIKEELKAKFSLGNSKLKAIFSYLNRAGLIEYYQENKGKFGKLSIRVLCGNKFLKDEPFSAGSISNPPEKPAGSISGRPVFRTSGSGLLLKEIKTLKEKKAPKENKSFCKNAQKQANAKKHTWAPMKNEKASIEKSKQHKKMVLPPDFKEMAAKILLKVKK